MGNPASIQKYHARMLDLQIALLNAFSEQLQDSIAPIALLMCLLELATI